MGSNEPAKQGEKPATPRAGRPRFPDGYGVPETNEGLLPWSYIEERMADALNYWISTTRPNGRPHATPVWGVWLERKLYLEGSPETRRVRNLIADPAVAVHLESGDKVVIVEGDAFPAGVPDRSLAVRLAAAYSAKYRGFGYAPSASQWDLGGLLVVHPLTVLAWTKFPQDATRWIIDSQAR